MPIDIGTRPLTVAEFERLPDEPGCRMELVRGRVVREPSAGTVVGADCRSRDAIRLLTENGELDGADVLPGFQVKVSDLFGR